MNTSSLTRKNVDEYLSHQSDEIRTILENIRYSIKEICPDAVESIAYGMPAYKLRKKPLIYFAAFTHHIWLYATPSAHEAFSKELAWYKQWKWSVQFPLDKPLPRDLIKKMILFKKEEIISKKQ